MLPVILKNKLTVFLCFFIVTIPLIIFTFDTESWSDDFQYIDVWAAYAKLTSPIQAILQPFGGIKLDHNVPVYWVISYLFTSISMNPKVLHLMVIFVFILTAFVIYRIAEEYYHDKVLGLLAGVLFLLNYHIAFKALNWNCLHCHLTNTFTGALSLYYFIKYLNSGKRGHLFFSWLFLVLTIFNFESGFLFLPALIVFAVFGFLNKKLSFKRMVIAIGIFSTVIPIYLGSAYIMTKSTFPMSYRFEKGGSPGRSIGEMAFNTNELFVRSMGFSQGYHQFVYERLKQDSKLKELVTDFVRGADKVALKKIILGHFKVLGIVFLSLIFFLAFLIFVLKYIQKKSAPFLVAYLMIFSCVIIIFARLDIANSIAVFSSIVVADLILTLLKKPQGALRMAGLCFLGTYFLLTVLTVADKFDDCYKTAFYGLSKQAFIGPGRLYRAINGKIGHYAAEGMLVFMHDYSKFHRTGGWERIGDAVVLGDLICSNIGAYQAEFLKHPNTQRLIKDRFIVDFSSRIIRSSKSKIIIVDSKEQALKKIKEENIDIYKMPAIYLSKDYRITKLNDDFKN